MIETILIAIIGLWLGSMEFRMRNLNDKIGKKPDRQEVTNEIKLRQESIRVLQAEIKEDIKEIKEFLKLLKLK